MRKSLTLKKELVDIGATLRRYVIRGRLISINTITIDDNTWIVQQVHPSVAAILANVQGLEYPIDTLSFGTNYYIGICVSDWVLPVDKLPTLDYIINLLHYYTNHAATGGTYVCMEVDINRKYY